MATRERTCPAASEQKYTALTIVCWAYIRSALLSELQRGRGSLFGIDQFDTDFAFVFKCMGNLHAMKTKYKILGNTSSCNTCSAKCRMQSDALYC